MLSLFKTGHEGMDWLVGRLDINAGSNSKTAMPIDSSLSSRLPLLQGQCLALLEYPLKGDLFKFDMGYYRDTTQLLPTLANWIQEYVQRDPSHLVLIDEQNSQIDDPSWIVPFNQDLQELTETALYCENSIFYRISHEDHPDHINTLLRMTYQLFFCCAFVKTNNIIKSCEYQSKVWRKDIEDAFTDIRGAIVSAYDDEGLVIWTAKQNDVTVENPF
jgi:hypothetical protein